MLRTVTVALALAVLPGAAGAQAVDSLRPPCGATADGTGCVYTISLATLIARPELYDGLRVRVEGYIHFEFEGNALYVHREDYREHLTTNSLFIRLRESFNRAPRCSDRYVILEGRFYRVADGARQGHIVDITRCTVIE